MKAVQLLEFSDPPFIWMYFHMMPSTPYRLDEFTTNSAGYEKGKYIIELVL
jgi:hypothetical protein